ncbi:MAG: tetratricopeptide repeat protein, partial [Myxococcota bacterium]
HSFRVPRPDVSMQLGTPNACTGCHTDRTAAWASDALTAWYGPPAKRASPQFAEVFDAARNGLASAVPDLTAIVSDSGQPAIIRATALELLSGFGPSTAAPAVAAMDDADPWVRATAARSLALLEPARQVAVGASLLSDPVRAVRVEAARVLASAEIESPALRRALDAAVTEYTDSQRAEADTPSAQLNLAVLAARRGDHESAIGSYRKAIELDPDFFPARANLAVLFGSLGRRNEAELLLREGIAREPDRGEFHYSLGLVLAEGGRFESAAGHIGRAAELMPKRARVQYNHGLALQRIGKHTEAERALLEAKRLAPRDPEIVYALAAYYVQRGRWEQARGPASDLVELSRGAPEALDLMRQVERALANPAAAD